MKNYFSRSVSYALAVASLCSLAAFTACGDSSSSASKSKAEECANGLSAECLQGSWNMLGFANNGTGEILPAYDYKAAPGKLTFNEDGTFQFDVPLSAPADLKAGDCNPVYGNWTISGTQLTLKGTINGMCLAHKSATFTPVIAAEGAEIKMSMGGLWLMENATDEVSIKSYAGEVYTISAN